MAAVWPASRFRIGALVCWGACVVLSIAFVAGVISPDRLSMPFVGILDAVLLLAGAMLYRRSRRLVSASPLCRDYRVE
jgi:peptidoglycan/LPS O-acetylase OafA/YrhL